MKQLLLLLIVISLSTISSKAQFVTIPDPNLRQWFMMSYSGCMNASQELDTTCVENLSAAYCTAYNVSNWDGFQYFKNLQTLEFDGAGPGLPAIPATVTNLKYNYIFLPSLPALPPALMFLRVYGNNLLTSLPALPSTLVSLDCENNNQLLSIPALPAGLNYLKVSNITGLTSLPALPSTLDTLQVNGCALTTIPALPSGLKFLKCDLNQITSLPALPSTLEYLEAQSNQLTAIPSVAGTSLQTLIINDNQITGISALPSTLLKLWFHNNQFTNLPTLPPGLTDLWCFNNQLATLPSIPSSMLNLWYNVTQPGFFPVLPNGLRSLFCMGNQISNIPSLPDSLRYLHCAMNLLTSLPALPSRLETLICYQNQLTSLPAFPPFLNRIDIQQNNITCLPILPPINVTDWYPLNINMDDIITCVPNIPAGPISFTLFDNTGFPDTSYSTMPICNVVNNVYHCASYPLLAGHIYYDNNGNGTRDANEPYRANVKVELSNGNYAFTDNNGFYQMQASDTGHYTLSISETHNYFNNVPSLYNFYFYSFDTLVVNDFKFQSAAVRDSLSISINPINGAARPGFPYPYQVVYANDGTTNLPSTIVFNYDNTRLIYDSCSNPSVINTGNSLTISEPGFVPGTQKNFIGYFRVNPSAVIGDSLRSGAHITSGSVASDDSAVVAIRGSYDPNDKSATPGLAPAQVANGDYIYYTIRFQNTGTDTAFNIVVTDTLDNKLQPSTLQMIATSHPCITTVKNNTISFEFINVLLPDSNVNELKSHGYISFRIKPLNTLVVNDIVPNKAAIYFDYNSPVITNIATTTVVEPIVVPLKLLSFNVSRGIGKHANIYWQTFHEVNVRHYEIEMSSNGRTFTNIGIENAKGRQYNNYTKTIPIPADAVLYFRLKMMDIDGHYTYSNVAILKNDRANSAFSFSNNPVTDELILSLQDESLRNTTATIFNAQGIKVRFVLLTHDVEKISIKSLPAGTYYLVTEKGSGQFVVIR